MNNEEDLRKIAVLIDADNTQLTKLKSILDEISTHGRIVVKKAFGDWKNPTLKNWENELNQLAIKPEQQFAYVTGKNATDIAMVIDAMDLLHTEMYDAFVLVSSDSDFTPLAIRLRESGVYVFGVGEEKTSQSFRNSCDEFLLTEYLTTPKTETENTASGQEAEMAVSSGADTTVEDIHALLKLAYDRYQDESDFVDVSFAGSYIKRARPDFDIRKYGVHKLTAFLEKYPKKYEMKKSHGKGNSHIIAYKCL